MGGIHQYMQAGITQGGIHIIIIGPRLALILPPDGWPPYIIVAAAIHLPSPGLLLRSGYKGWKRSPTRQSRYGGGALRVYAPERFNVQAGAACKCPSENAATPSPALTSHVCIDRNSTSKRQLGAKQTWKILVCLVK